MSNVFAKLGVDIAGFGKWIADTVKEVCSIASRIEKILKSEKPLEAPFIAGLSTVVSDLEALVAAAEAAVSTEGLNFPADSKAYQEFLTLIADFKKLAPIVEQAVAILEGKAAK